MLEKMSGNNKNKLEITIATKTVLRVVLVVIGALLFLAAIGRASYPLTLIFVAFFLSIALNGPVSWLSHRMPGKLRGNRSAATGISFLIVVILLGAFLLSIVPPLAHQTTTFINNVPQYIDDARDENTDIGKFVQRYNLEGQIDKFSENVSKRFDDIGGTAFSTVTRVGGSVFATLTVLVLTFMMLVEGPAWIDLFREFVPKHKREHTDGLIKEMYKVVRGYVNGQVLLAALAASLILVPLFLLDIKYPVALMVIVFFCGLIPMIGHYIGASIVTLVALLTSPWAALIILIYYILYQQVENYVIQPTVQANSTNMSPLLVFGSVLIGVSFGGLLGGLFAIPVVGCLRVLLLDYLKSRHYLGGKALDEYSKATQGTD